MIVRLNIDSDCDGILHYTKEKSTIYLSKYRSRLTEYEGEQLIKEIKDIMPETQTIYLYTIRYPDGKVSVVATPDKPIGQLTCESMND